MNIRMLCRVLGLILLILAGLLTVSGWILAAVRKKRNWRSYVFPLLLGLAAAGAALVVASSA